MYGSYKPDDPHITLSSKNKNQEQEKTHRTGHGYTKSMDDLTLVRTSPSPDTKADNFKDRKGKEIWAQDLPSETTMHQGGEGS